MVPQSRPVRRRTGSSLALLVAAGIALFPGAPAAQVMPPRVERFDSDHGALRRFYDLSTSPLRLARLTAFEADEAGKLAALDFEALSVDDRIDHLLMQGHLASLSAERARFTARLAANAELLAFGEAILELEQARWRLQPVDPRAAADTLEALAGQIEGIAARVKAGTKPGARGDAADDDDDEDVDEDSVDADDDASDGDDDDDVLPLSVTPVDARWAARLVDEFEGALGTWAGEYADYLPGFTWWTDEPLKRARDEARALSKLLREKVAGLEGEDDDPLIGDPIGRDALVDDLALERIAYSPEELLAIGEAQFAWCEQQMRLAAGELGFGDDWRAALESVKQAHVDPGAQDALVTAQAREALRFLDDHDLVTVPELCRETWRLRMIDQQGQRTLPFAAYGGQVMLVAYPTAGMDHEAKLMSMRGNNEHFSRIVTPHELMPGHHLQGFMAQREATHRRLFRTPFLAEGWALYWELRLWELDWARDARDRIGMLFWRMHRAARILVSLRFHLGELTPDEMIDFLVERVGHERASATSEVRRYIAGDYSPLYQCAYLIGGLQLQALHAELVVPGGLTERQFHDAVLRQGAIPVELIRAALTATPLPRDHTAAWRFAGDP